MNKHPTHLEVQLLQVTENFLSLDFLSLDFLSLDNTVQIRPWFRRLSCAPTRRSKRDVCEAVSRSGLGQRKYRFGWQFVVGLVLIAVALASPPLGWAVELAEPASLQPKASLYDQQGAVFAEQQLLGNLSVVNFFFTSCPEACPTQMRKLNELYRNLPAVYDKPVNFVSFSIDPARDSQSVLAQYATKMRIDNHSWRLITGEPEALQKIRLDYGSVVQKINPDGLNPDGLNNGAEIDHSLIVYLQDAQARVLMTYVGADVDAVRIQQDILTLQRLKRDIPLR